jgi:predicted hydrocarbon binding protein
MSNLEEFFRKILFARQLKVNDGYLSIYGEPYVMFPAESFSILMESIIESSGKKGKIKIYKEGVKIGESIAERLEKSINTKGDKLLEVIFNIGGMGGWGIWKLYKKDVSKKEGIVHGYNIATAKYSYLRKKKNEPSCHFLRGIIAGELRVSWVSRDIDVIETRCISQGSDYCEFIAKRKVEFDKKNKFVKTQLEL